MPLCPKCNLDKAASHFYKNRARPSGLSATCKDCLYHSIGGKAKGLAYATKRRTENPIRMLLIAAKSRAKRDGVPFDITADQLYQPDRCPIFGIPLRYNGSGRGYGAKEDAASLDRLRWDEGYVPGNVVIVSWKANRAKSFLTPEEVALMHQFYSNFIRP